MASINLVLFCIFPSPSSFLLAHLANRHQSRKSNKTKQLLVPEEDPWMHAAYSVCFSSPRWARAWGQEREQTARAGEVGGKEQVGSLQTERGRVASMGKTREGNGWAVLENAALPQTHTHKSSPHQESQALVSSSESRREDWIPLWIWSSRRNWIEPTGTSVWAEAMVAYFPLLSTSFTHWVSLPSKGLAFKLLRLAVFSYNAG